MLNKKQTYEESLSGRKVRLKGVDKEGKETEIFGKFVAFGLEVAKPAGTASFTVAIVKEQKTGELFTAPVNVVYFLEKD